MACGLIGAKTKTIGFVFNYSSVELSHDLSYVELFHFIAKAATGEGYKVFFHSSMSAKPIREVLDEVAAYGVDGIILGSNVNNQEDRQALYESDMPTVIFSRDIFAKKTSSVMLDDVQGGSLATAHLLGLGHKRIAFVGKHGNETSVRRFEGYRNTLQAAGIVLRPELIVECGYSMEEGQAAALQILKLTEIPTAIVAAGDFVAIGLIDALRERGVKVPDEMSIVGFDNLSLSRIVSPSLTTIDRYCEKLATIAVESLLELLGSSSYGQRKVLPVGLIERQSTGPCKK
jgi:DNA-binding LacI/PurR family transcriptional regulator